MARGTEGRWPQRANTIDQTAKNDIHGRMFGCLAVWGHLRDDDTVVRLAILETGNTQSVPQHGVELLRMDAADRPAQ